MSNEPVLAVPLWALDRPWLKIQCVCGRCVHMAISRAVGGTLDQRTLGTFVERLRCQACRERPAVITLDDTGNAFSHGGPKGRRIWILRERD